MFPHQGNVANCMETCRCRSFGLRFSINPRLLSPLSAYICLNAPLYPFPSSIYLPPSVIRPLIPASALLHSSSTLHTVSLIYLSSPFLKVITRTDCFGRLKQRPTEKGDEVCHICQPSALSNARACMQMQARTFIDTDTSACYTRAFSTCANTHECLRLPRTCSPGATQLLSHTCTCLSPFLCTPM